jgi:hypothetical protein
MTDDDGIFDLDLRRGMVQFTASLLSADVPITAEVLEDAIERAALACCRGPVQVVTVLTLIQTGEIYDKVEYSPFARSGSWTVGTSDLGYASWRNLCKRLRAADGMTRETESPEWATYARELADTNAPYADGPTAEDGMTDAASGLMRRRGW